MGAKLTTAADTRGGAAPGAGDVRAADADGIVLRRVETREEYADCVRMQDEVWGAGFAERVPATILAITQKVGGVTAGAFGPDGRLLGFVFGLTGVRGGRLVHWSDMLAVRPEARDRGLGTRLKRYQRDLVRPLGVETMLWTFDPLVARNAHLNLNHLGARVAEYVRDMYGSETGSALHGALGTDRFIAEWDLTGAAPPAGGAPDPSAPVVNAPSPDGAPTDGPLVDAPTVRVQIPDDIHAVLAADPAVARRWREATRRAFLWYLDRGYRVGGVGRVGGAGPVSYWLTAS
jgi:predicted GNAT superfamily acetyltransferase